MSPGEVMVVLTYCWFVMSRRPGHQTGTALDQTWGCLACGPSGNLGAASSSVTSVWGSSCVSCICARITTRLNSKLNMLNKCNILNFSRVLQNPKFALDQQILSNPVQKSKGKDMLFRKEAGI